MRLPKEFTFAGFDFPRYIPQITPKDKNGRTFRAVYYTAPRPITGGNHPGLSFYLGDMGSFSRYKLAHDIATRTIRHKGWYCDNFQDETITGIVIYLPHGKLLAGWTMGAGMISAVECDTIYNDELTAALAADSIAEYVAEKEREYCETDGEH